MGCRRPFSHSRPRARPTSSHTDWPFCLLQHQRSHQVERLPEPNETHFLHEALPAHALPRLEDDKSRAAPTVGGFTLKVNRRGHLIDDILRARPHRQPSTGPMRRRQRCRARLTCNLSVVNFLPGASSASGLASRCCRVTLCPARSAPRGDRDPSAQLNSQ